uniref:Ionotropic receptor 7 n=1 Tax=Phyllotreta striolata TaxID=444603 RepID=A0A1B1FKI0_PHYSR|nr:ionotropic receptor 7 [Phyllotreta striolata]
MHTDNSFVWAKIGDAKFFYQLSKDILIYGGGCVLIFYDTNTRSEKIFLANSPQGNGDGIGAVRGHKVLNVFAYSENCAYPRVFVKTYPSFEDIFEIEGNETPESYSYITFTDTLIIMLGSYPKFTISVRDWVTQQKLCTMDTYAECDKHVLRCNWTKPINMIDLWIGTKKIAMYEFQMCCKEFHMTQNIVQSSATDGTGNFTSVVWTPEGSMCVCDEFGTIYMMDNEYSLEKVLDVKISGPSPPAFEWYKNGFLVCGPDKTMRHYVRKLPGEFVLNRSIDIEAEPALIYDSVYVFAVGLQTLEQSHTLKLSNLSCDKEQPWDGGLSLINYINSVEIKGLSGPIEFKEGRRIQFKLDLLKLKQPSLVKVGEWQPGNGVNITDRAAFFDPGTMNVTLVVTTILEMPYVMMHTAKNFTGNSRFYGFCIDILGRISQEVGFDYLLDLVPDRKYGARDPNTGLWNGMVLQLMQHKADLAVGSMTINYARESVIDFTKPFMNLGISILFKVPSSRQAKLFSFMNPLATNIWLYVLSAYVLVSITMFVVARFSPCEWQNPHPCEIDNELVKNQFSLANSFWFTIGTLMQQGSDLNPKATSTRIVGGIWWFFTLIIISSYTANLAAFLTVERMITPIEDAEDLAAQTEIPYGTLESGSTMTFFRDSMIETYKKMWRFMENRKPSVFVPTYEEGIQKVLDGNYAFLMESTMLDYIVQRNCNLTQIGGPLDSKGYGIATPKGSPWRDKISLAILELQEKGEIQMLYDKWWKNTGDTCQRNDKGKESKANSLGVDNIGGVFVVLLCGLAFAVLIAIFEFCYNSKKNALNEKRSASVPQESLCSEMKSEFCFALRCSGSRQRPALRRKCSKCLSGVSYVPAVLDVPPNPPQPPTRGPPPADHSPALGASFDNPRLRI